LYDKVKIRILGAEGPLRGAPPSGRLVIKRDRFLGDGVLRAAMREAGHWDEREVWRRTLLGDACHMIMEGPRCVHYSWLSESLMNISEIGYQASLSDGHRWVYNAYTTPAHRGRKLFQGVLSGISQDTAAGGVLWAGVLEGNTSSLQAILKAGFTESLVLERGLALSSFAMRRRKTVVDARLGERFNRLDAVWEAGI
jgi:hypothetical protein